MVAPGRIEGSLAYELAVHAGKVGADAVASIPPFVGGYSWEELYSYYRRLCEVSSVPVVGYYIPTLSGQAISIDNLAKLGELPNLAGFKVTDTNLYNLQRLAMRLRQDQILYNGPDELLALGLMMDADGGIGTTYNFMGRNSSQSPRTWQPADSLRPWPCRSGSMRRSKCFHLPRTGGFQTNPGLARRDRQCHAAPRASLTAGQQAHLRRRLAGTVVADSLKL